MDPVVVLIKEQLDEETAELTVGHLLDLLHDCDPEAVVWIRKQGKGQEETPLIAIEDFQERVNLVV